MELEPGPFFVQLGGQGRFSGQISDLAVNQPEAKADPKSRLTYIHRRPRHPPRRGAYISVFRLLYYAYQQWFPLRILRARRGGYGNSPLGLGAPRYFTMGIWMYLVPTWEALYSPWTSAFCFWGPQSNLAFTTAIAAKQSADCDVQSTAASTAQMSHRGTIHEHRRLYIDTRSILYVLLVPGFRSAWVTALGS